MEVRQLEIFRILAEELNFTRTAEKVHTVQSNVTAQIKALEEELGVPLFDRLGRRVTLTDAGRNFLPFAGQALAAMEQGQRAVQTGAEPSGPLRQVAGGRVLVERVELRAARVVQRALRRCVRGPDQREREQARSEVSSHREDHTACRAFPLGRL